MGKEIKYNEEINYKTLCEMIGENQYSGGTQRERQLARLNKTYEIEKVGRGKYIIKRRKSDEEIKLESDKKNYSNYLQAVLLNMIANSPDVEMVFTYRQIRENLMMVNEKYFPVKYNKKEIDYKLPYNYTPPTTINAIEKEWFGYADKHDEDMIKYSLECLYEKSLLVGLEKTYMFYKFEKSNNGNVVFHKPVQATSEQLAEIRQRQLEFMQEVIPESRMKMIKREVENENNDIDLYNEHTNSKKKKKKDLLGACIRELYNMNPLLVNIYFGIVDEYIEELGYNRYARAFRIIRPTRLDKIAGYYLPEFNEKQVHHYLNSPRFKMVSRFFHNKLTEELIKSDFQI